MRTTLDLSEKLIRELMNVTGAQTKTDAIHQAAAELIRRKKLDQLKSLSGAIHLDLDWKSLEEAEIRHQVSLKRRRSQPRRRRVCRIASRLPDSDRTNNALRSLTGPTVP